MLKELVNGVRVIVSTISLQAEKTSPRSISQQAPAHNPRTTSAAPKRTRIQIAQAQNDLDLRDLQAAGGIVARSAWTVGTGNYQRNVPNGAAVYASYDSAAPAHVQAWFAQHPRAQNAVAIITV